MLYFVATPIGNLKDVSLRAVEVLKEVDEIGCEDTRHSITFLKTYGIEKPLFSYHKFNEKEACEKIIAKLSAGKNIAIISDAGTPVISDPGNILVQRLKREGLDYTVIPGACALISALVLSGFDARAFTFLGFLPDKKGKRREVLEKYKDLDTTLIFYCAPHDIEDYVGSLYEVLGDRRACAVKEITKIHETATEFSLKDGGFPDAKGEYVLIVEGKKQDDFGNLSEEEHISLYLSQGMDKKEALKRVAKERGVSKSSLYKYTLEK